MCERFHKSSLFENVCEISQVANKIAEEKKVNSNTSSNLKMKEGRRKAGSSRVCLSYNSRGAGHRERETEDLGHFSYQEAEGKSGFSLVWRHLDLL